MKLELSGSVVLTVARLVPRKGIDKLIEVVSEIDEITLVVVGDGPLELGFKKLSENSLKHLGEFSWASLLERTLAIIESGGVIRNEEN